MSMIAIQNSTTWPIYRLQCIKIACCLAVAALLLFAGEVGAEGSIDMEKIPREICLKLPVCIQGVTVALGSTAKIVLNYEEDLGKAIVMQARGWSVWPDHATPLPNHSERQRVTIGTEMESALKIDRASFDAMLKDYPDAKLRVILVDDPCLAKMKAALRAMEPFIPFEDVHGLVNVLPTNGLKAFKKANEQWDAAKACWREP